MTRFAPGQLVVCTRTNDPKYSYLVHAVGEVRQLLPTFISLLMEADYAVFFPQFNGQKCNHCGRDHKGHFAMAHNELKALDDPDSKEDDRQTEKPEEFGFVG